MRLLSELMKKVEEKNKKLVSKERKVNLNESKIEKNNKKVKKATYGYANVTKDDEGNIYISHMGGVEKISVYDIGLMWKQVEQTEKEISDVLKKLNSEKNIKEYIAYKFGSVVNPASIDRFVFPYVSKSDPEYFYKYGRAVMDILFGNTADLTKIINFE